MEQIKIVMVMLQNFQGNDCDDNDPTLHQNDIDDDGFRRCDGDCNDDDPSLYPIEMKMNLLWYFNYEYSPTNIIFIQTATL